MSLVETLLNELSLRGMGMYKPTPVDTKSSSIKEVVKEVKRPAFFPFTENKELIGFLNSDINIEVEASLGRYFGKSFIPGVTKNGHSLLLKYFLAQDIQRENGSMQIERVLTKEVRSGNLRKIIHSDGTVIYQEKKRKATIDVREWGYRVSSSIERFLDSSKIVLSQFEFAENVETVEGPSKIPKEQNLAIRIKDRYSFIETSEVSPFNGTKIDITYVVQDDGYITRPFYEVEIERHRERINKNSFIRAIQAITLLANGIIESVALTPSNEVVGFNKLPSLSEKNLVIGVWNSLFRNDMRKLKLNLSSFKLFKAKNKPVPLKLRDLVVSPKRNEYVLTVKYDGLRALILFTNFGTYIIDPPYSITRLNFIVKEENGTILDGELFENNGTLTYSPFDILFRKGVDMRRTNFLTRVSTFKDVKVSSEMFLIRHKEFIYKEGGLYKNVKLAYDELEFVEDEGISTDGLIFQPLNTPYYAYASVKKWKPPEKLTIDFLLLRTEENPEEFRLYVTGKKDKIVPFTGTKRVGYTKTVFIENGLWNDVPVDSQILEMKWDGDKQNFVIERFRPDRQEPNFIQWAIDVWKDIHNPVYLSSITGEDMKGARIYFNDIKRRLLTSYFRKGEIIMDIGSGYGPDLGKWKQLELEKVIVVDPSIENLQVLQQRAQNLEYENLEILNIGADDTKDLTNYIRNKKYERMDGITAFFSLTFFGESRRKMAALVETIAANIKDNGNFMCIVMDGNKVKNLLGVDEQYSTKGWSIRSVDIREDRVFGNKIITTINDNDSMVKDVEEYLFPFNEFVEMLKERDIELQTTYTLSYPEVLSEQQEEFAKLNRVAVFVKLPPKMYSRLSPIPIGEVSEIDTPYPEILVRTGTVGEGSCFFHSVLQAFSEKYKRMSTNEKKVFVAKLRRNLASLLDMQTFGKLGNGILAEFMQQKYRKDTDSDEKAFRLGYVIFVKTLADCSSWLGEEALEYLSNSLNLDVYIMNDRTRNVQIAPDCELMYKHRPSIIVLNIDNIHYETVGRKSGDSGAIQTIFAPNDPLIVSMYRSVCNLNK